MNNCIILSHGAYAVGCVVKSQVVSNVLTILDGACCEHLYEFGVPFVPQNGVAWSVSVRGFTALVTDSDTLRKAYISSCEYIPFPT